jgi:hypothetical protein
VSTVIYGRERVPDATAGCLPGVRLSATNFPAKCWEYCWEPVSGGKKKGLESTPKPLFLLGSGARI